jgi:response regulator RpfG family c-di-GMP phosphodiesterase/Flp pilus assembly protein TadD
MLSGVLPTIDNIEQNAKILLESAFEMSHGDPYRALTLIQKSIELAKPELSTHALLLVGKSCYEQNYVDLALSAFNDALKYSQKTSSHELTIEILHFLGRIHRDLGQFDHAIRHLVTALEYSQKYQYPHSEVDSLNLIATIYASQGSVAMALKLFNQSFNLAKCHNIEEKIPSILSNIGRTFYELGNYEQALKSLSKACRKYDQQAFPSRDKAANLISLGKVYEIIGDVKNALFFFEQAHRVGIESSDIFTEITAINNLAHLHLNSGEWELAKVGFERALSISKMGGFKKHEIDNLEGLGKTHLALNQHHQAVEYHAKALAISKDIGDRQNEINSLLNLGRVYLSQTNSSQSLAVLHDVLSFSLVDYPHAAYEVHELLSQSYALSGNYEQAFLHHQLFYEKRIQYVHAENNHKVRELSIQFDVEQAQQKAEEYRLRTELEQTGRQNAEREVRERTKELEDTRLEIVNRLATAGEYRDDATGEHTRRVGRNAAIIAFMLGWTEDEVQLIFYAARLHDVGKIGIRDAILLKPGKLTDDEMNIMKSHTTKGAGILSGGQSRLLQLAEEIALSHHEKWDGTGYPHQLSGVEIPLSARIVAIADVIDALTHKRVYKDAWTLDDALAEIEKLSGSHFDPLLAEIVLRVFKRQDIIQTLDTNDWKLFYSQLEAFLYY